RRRLRRTGTARRGLRAPRTARSWCRFRPTLPRAGMAGRAKRRSMDQGSSQVRELDLAVAHGDVFMGSDQHAVSLTAQSRRFSGEVANDLKRCPPETKPSRSLVELDRIHIMGR